jgi:hypothetical protein
MEEKMSNTYFATDGSYGDASGLVIVDTSKWTHEQWQMIEETSDSFRAIRAIEEGKNG